MTEGEVAISLKTIGSLSTLHFFNWQNSKSSFWIVSMLFLAKHWFFSWSHILCQGRNMKYAIAGLLKVLVARLCLNSILPIHKPWKSMQQHKRQMSDSITFVLLTQKKQMHMADSQATIRKAKRHVRTWVWTCDLCCQCFYLAEQPEMLNSTLSDPLDNAAFCLVSAEPWTPCSPHELPI